MPARARSEGERLLKFDVRSVWAPASLELWHVGHAGVGVVSLLGALIFFACCRYLLVFLIFPAWSVFQASFACCWWSCGSPGSGVWFSRSLN